MSDWELVESGDSQKQAMKPQNNNSDWEIVPTKSNSRQQSESLGASASYAPFRIAEDVGKKLYGAVQAIPGYYEKAKTEVPGWPNLLEEHPIHAAGQGLAGLNEAINFLAQLPLDAAKYLGSGRLNLLPESVQNAIQKITPQDTTQAINQLFGEPKYPGEAALRGIGRNILPIAGTARGLSAMPHLTQHGATRKLNRAQRLAEERNIGQMNVNPQLVQDARQFLPNTLPYRNNLTTAGTGDYNSLFRLQSDLGQHASDYAKSLFSAAERQHGRAGLEARARLLDEMHGNLQTQGHHDISNLLREGQNDYRRYIRFRPIRNSLIGAGAASALPWKSMTKTLTEFLLRNR